MSLRQTNSIFPNLGYVDAAVDPLFPLMDSSSAVSPIIRCYDDTLNLAFYLPSCEDSAVVQFQKVSTWFYGYPNDERLSMHALWGHGLTFYNFHIVSLADQNTQQPNCWVATFHDGSFEILAERVIILNGRVIGYDPTKALASMLGEEVYDLSKV